MSSGLVTKTLGASRDSVMSTITINIFINYAKKGEWHVFLPATACVGSMAAIVIICTEVRKETD